MIVVKNDCSNITTLCENDLVNSL